MGGTPHRTEDFVLMSPPGRTSSLLSGTVRRTQFRVDESHNRERAVSIGLLLVHPEGTGSGSLVDLFLTFSMYVFQ